MAIENLIKGEPDWHLKVNNNDNELSSKIGDLTILTTTDKTSLVNAVIENTASLLENTQNINLNKANLNKVNTNVLYTNAINSMQNVPLNSLNQIKTAIANKSIKVAFWGDSISGGYDQVSSTDCYTNLVVNKLRKSLTNITISDFNFSIGGRGIGHATDSTFIGGTTDTDATFKTSWSINGKSWRDHIKDFAPDLLFIAFGMNDIGAYIGGYHTPDEWQYTKLQELCTYISTWSKIPSIVIIPTMLPTNNAEIQSHFFVIREEDVKTVARASREFAKNNNYPIADANRLFTILRDGKDDVQRQSFLEKNWNGYSDGKWVGDLTAYTLSDNLLTAIGNTNKFVTRNRNFYNGSIEFEFKPNDASSYTSLEYRIDSKDLGGITILLIGGNISFYANGASIGGIGGQPMTVGTYNKIKIEIDGSIHKVYYNDVFIYTLKTSKMLHEGYIKLGTNGTALTDFRNLNIVYKDEISYAPLLSESDILGEYDSIQSGNSFNHPSSLGHFWIYYSACECVINSLIDNNLISFSKMFTVTHDISVIETQNVILPFKPKSINIFGMISGVETSCNGFCDGDENQGSIMQESSGIMRECTSAIGFYSTGGWWAIGTVSNISETGFTITWAKPIGSPTGIAILKILVN